MVDLQNRQKTIKNEIKRHENKKKLGLSIDERPEDEELEKLFASYGDRYCEVFKTITADNGSEFSNLSELEEKGVGIYFTHPYASCEKGTVERHNRMLRRFIPKGKSIDDYSADEIMMFADIINGLPRKILGYQTPEELFEKELDRIYAT